MGTIVIYRELLIAESENDNNKKHSIMHFFHNSLNIFMIVP